MSIRKLIQEEVKRQLGLVEEKNKSKKKVIEESIEDPRVKAIIEDALRDNFEDIENNYEFYNGELEEVESKSRDGFIPFTDGGFEITGFIALSSMNSSDNFPSNIKARKALEDIVNDSYDNAKSDFERENKDLVDELGEDKINYHDLYDLGYKAEAEELSQIEMDYMSDETVMFQIGVYYYDIDNMRNEFEGKSDSVYVYGVINWEAPYHRQKDKFEAVAKSSQNIPIDVNNLRDFENRLNRLLKLIVKELL